MNTEPLEEIGLTQGEIKVYISLLELGSSSAGPVLEKSGLHNSVVHMALNKLIEKGLISFTFEGKHRIYSASNPKHILDYIEQKKKGFEALLPELLAKKSYSEKKPEALTFSGKRGIKEILFELLEAGGNEHLTLGSPYESVMMGDAFWIDYHKRRAKKKIRAKIIFNSSLKEWATKIQKAGNYSIAELRYLKEGFEPLTEIIIRNDKVGILLWTEKPTGILIHNKTLADSYKRHFALMWENAENQ